MAEIIWKGNYMAISCFVYIYIYILSHYVAYFVCKNVYIRSSPNDSLNVCVYVWSCFNTNRFFIWIGQEQQIELQSHLGMYDRSRSIFMTPVRLHYMYYKISTDNYNYVRNCKHLIYTKIVNSWHLNITYVCVFLESCLTETREFSIFTN